MLIFHAEMQLIFCKDNANREQGKMSHAHFPCRDAAYFLQKYIFFFNTT